MMNHRTLKHALISVLVGAAISFLVTLLQGVIDALQGTQQIPAAVSGGVVWYVRSWRTNLTG